jgi:small ligand-binding sensory domain FIST
MKFAHALSTLAHPASNCEEVCTKIGGELSGEIDLAVVFASGHFSSQASAISKRLLQRLNCKCLIGCIAESVIGGAQEVENEPAISVLAARLPGVKIHPLHLQYERSPDGGAFTGWPETWETPLEESAGLMLLGDPYSFPTDVFLERMNEDFPALRIFGGMTSGGATPGDSRILWQDQVLDTGALAIAFGGDVQIDCLVSQGCRPIGEDFVITKTEANEILELGGKPALEQLKHVFGQLPTSDQKLIQNGLHVGRVVNEHQDQFTAGDFLIRNVIGGDANRQSIAVGEYYRPGQTIRFHLRDEHSAHAELKSLLASMQKEIHSPSASLVFSCNGRGTRLFSEPNHDASLVHKGLNKIPTAGFFAAGEVGPIGGRNFLHGFTASIAVLSPRRVSDS